MLWEEKEQWSATLKLFQTPSVDHQLLVFQQFRNVFLPGFREENLTQFFQRRFFCLCNALSDIASSIFGCVCFWEKLASFQILHEQLHVNFKSRCDEVVCFPCTFYRVVVLWKSFYCVDVSCFNRVSFIKFSQYWSSNIHIVVSMKINKIHYYPWRLIDI